YVFVFRLFLLFSFFILFFLIIRPPPSSTLFPYTTLFRSFGSRLNAKRIPPMVVISSLPAFSLAHVSPSLATSFCELSRVWAMLRSEEHTSELQSRENLVCRLLLEKKKKRNVKNNQITSVT